MEPILFKIGLESLIWQNPGKFQVMLFESKVDNNNITLMVEKEYIHSKNEAILLTVTIDDKLTSKKHRNNLLNSKGLPKKLKQER